MKRLFMEGTKPLTHLQFQEKRERVQFERTSFYVNRLPADVYVLDRSGMVTKIEPRMGSSAFAFDSLYICEQINCLPDIVNSYIQQARNTPNNLRQYRHHAVLQQWVGEPPVSSRYEVEAQTALKLSVLEENDGIVYLEDFDVVVMYNLSQAEMKYIRHPYTLQGHAVRSFEQVRDDNSHIRKGDFTFNIRIVDNNNQFGSRWILIGDTPFPIVAGKDKELADGIYVTYSKNMLNGEGPKRLLTDRFDFADSGNLPYYKLYESQQEALLERRSNQIDEAKARIHELAAKQQAAETSLRKAQQERENLERESQLRQEKHEQEMTKLRRENEKLMREHEHYMQKQVGEILATSRKNTTELIKCVPAILSTIAVAATLFRKKE
jgi:hypothetical protein